jgi:hypothetical protein
LPLCDPAENLFFRHDKNEPAIQLKQDHCLHPVHQFVSHLFVCFATLVSIAKGTILPLSRHIERVATRMVTLATAARESRFSSTTGT